MTKDEALRLGYEIMEQHLPLYWKLEINTRIGSLGFCMPRRGLIEISIHTVKGGKDLFVKTLLHEIAHALDYIRHGGSGHGSTWKQIMIELGQDPSRLATEEESKQFRKSINYKYDIHCENPECDVHFNRMRKSSAAKNWICKKCGEKGIKSKFIWTQNF